MEEKVVSEGGYRLRKRIIIGAIGSIFVVGIVIVVVVMNISPFISGATAQYAQPQTTGLSTNPITIENARPGAWSWIIPQNDASVTQIQAYADATSVLPGQKLTLYVSTQLEGTAYTIDFYRMGWYSGAGARLMASVANQVGHAQGNYAATTRQLAGCHSCSVNTQTGLIEANWQPSYTLTVPDDWLSGIYLAKLTDAQNMQSYVPFDVRDNRPSLYIAVTPDTTYAAYNDWGGYSLYDGEGGLVKGVKVSFDRPYDLEAGSSQVLAYEFDAIRWMERQGYDVSYMSDVDLHNNPQLLLQHKAYISLGHDEYWTKEMRDGVEYARDHGVGLAFMGANASYWQMRFEPDSLGVKDRTIVCYKVLTAGKPNNYVTTDLRRDPFYGKDNSRVTSQWRDPVVNRPENALVGIMFSNFTHQQLGFPWQVDADAHSPLLAGTGLKTGQSYGCDLVGYEWDHQMNNGLTPAGLQILATSKTVSDTNQSDFSNTAYYIARSGAMVFASGSILWASALDSYRLHADSRCAPDTIGDPDIQILMAHVMAALIVRHPAGQLATTTEPTKPTIPAVTLFTFAAWRRS